jgi:hypothetical protein
MSNNNQTPTAEEFRKQILKARGRISENDLLIEFAKLHVKAALQAASDSTDIYDFDMEIKQSYPLDKIQ